MMAPRQCLGGWCTRREKCAHYWAPQPLGVPPAERLCNAEGEMLSLPAVDNRTRQREEFAADPRFAQWVAGR